MQLVKEGTLQTHSNPKGMQGWEEFVLDVLPRRVRHGEREEEGLVLSDSC